MERWLKSYQGRQGMVRQLLRIRSALKISRWWRGTTTRRKYLEVKRLVTKIQARFRRQLEMRRYRQLRKEAINIQRWFRRAQEKKALRRNDLGKQVPVKQSEECEMPVYFETIQSVTIANKDEETFCNPASVNQFNNNEEREISFDIRDWNFQEVGKKPVVKDDVPEVSASRMKSPAIVAFQESAEICASGTQQLYKNCLMHPRCFDKERALTGLQAYEKILSVCRQRDVLSFEAVLPCSDPKRWKKLGEGNYGEVFGWKEASGVLSRVFKLIPVEGRDPESDFPQDTIKDVLPELIATRSQCYPFTYVVQGITDDVLRRLFRNMSSGAVVFLGKGLALSATQLCSIYVPVHMYIRKLSELSELVSPNFTQGFVKVHGLRYVRGKYPQVFSDCRKSRKRKEKKSPELKKYLAYDKSQRYIVIDTEYVGRPLALMKYFTPLQASSIFQQVACSLAAAEEIYNFEHRDLHPGNVLISYTNDDVLEFKVCGETIHVLSQELRATIIDYSLSRLECDGVIYFRDLRDHEFSGYDRTYRMMREHNRNRWSDFYPRTNVFWLQKLWYHIYGKMVHVWCDKNNEYTSKFQFCCVGAEIMDFHSATAIAMQYLPFLATMHCFTGERLHITKYKIPRQSLPSSDQQDKEDDELYRQNVKKLSETSL